MSSPEPVATVELVVGRLGRAHGVRGDLIVDVRTDEPERRFTDGTVFETPAGRLTVSATREHSGRLLVSFAEVADRNAAERLRGVELRVEIPADTRPDDPDEYYDHQLVGLRVDDVEGRVVGTVAEVLHLPGQDVLAVRRPDRPEALVPFVAELVPSVDLADGRVVVAAVPGLLDEAVDEAVDEVVDGVPSRAEPAHRGPETSGR